MSAILGVLFASLVGLLMIPTYMHFETMAIDNAKAATTAQQMQQVSQAAQAYIQANYSAVEANSTASSPATITVSMLQNTGYLPNAFSAANPFGQLWQVQVLQPTPGQLQALLLTQGGTQIGQVQAPMIAAQAGAQGGFVPYNGQYGTLNDTVAHGAYSGWQVSMSGYTNPGPGHLAALLAFNNGNLENNYLYRVAVPGQPQLNTMQTNLNMGANSVNNAQDVNVNGDVDVNSTQETLGSGGTAQVTINSPNANVPAGIALNDSGAGGWGVRLQTNPADNNWLELTGNNGSVVSSWQGGNYSAMGNVNAQNALTVNGGSDWWANNAGDSSQSGNAYVGGQVTANYDARLGTANGTANQNWGCSEYGEIAASASGNGQAMMCNGSSWQPIGGNNAPLQMYSEDLPSGQIFPGQWQFCAVTDGYDAWVDIYPIAGPYSNGTYTWGTGNGQNGYATIFTCYNLPGVYVPSNP